MKYSLRSLMIVVTLVAMLLGGRVEYLRRGAAYHEQEAHRWAMQIKEETGYDPEIAPAVFMRSNVLPFPYSQYEAHDRLAREYRYAVSCPWTVVQAPMPPKDEKEMWDRILGEIRQKGEEEAGTRAACGYARIDPACKKCVYSFLASRPRFFVPQPFRQLLAFVEARDGRRF